MICFQSAAIIGIAPIAKISFARTIKDLEERNRHLNKICSNLPLKKPKMRKRRIYIYKPNGLFYCKVPKCGSTYWMRFFQVLNNIKPEKDPFDTFRFKIHRTQMKMTKLEKNQSLNLNETIRFLVTRSPYSRLYSAYVDKLFLPELWNSYGRNIVKNLRPNATELSKACGNDVTFAEFLKMIAYRDRVHINWRNPHWLPIEQLCSPCTYKYNFIIRQETFSRDRDYLVSKVGIKEQFILKYNNISHWDYSLSVIKDLCRTIFMHFRKRKPKKCYRIEVLLQRLFVSFQIQGYIRKDARFDINRFGDLKHADIKTIAEVFQNIYKEYPVRTRNDWKEQRQKLMKDAYKLVDTEILEKIKKCYHLDFQIFNYDTKPEEIFGNR